MTDLCELKQVSASLEDEKAKLVAAILDCENAIAAKTGAQHLLAAESEALKQRLGLHQLSSQVRPSPQ